MCNLLKKIRQKMEQEQQPGGNNTIMQLSSHAKEIGRLGNEPTFHIIVVAVFYVILFVFVEIGMIYCLKRGLQFLVGRFDLMPVCFMFILLLIVISVFCLFALLFKKSSLEPYYRYQSYMADVIRDVYESEKESNVSNEKNTAAAPVSPSRSSASQSQ